MAKRGSRDGDEHVPRAGKARSVAHSHIPKAGSGAPAGKQPSDHVSAVRFRQLQEVARSEFFSDDNLTEMVTCADELMAAVGNSTQQAIEMVGGLLIGEHMNPEVIQQHFKGFPGLQTVLEVARHGVPVNVTPSRAFDAELRRKNAETASVHGGVLRLKVVQDFGEGKLWPISMKTAQALSACLRLAPVCVLVETNATTGVTKHRVIHNLKAVVAGPNGSSVNADTDLQSAPKVTSMDAFPKLTERVWGLRQLFPNRRIVIGKMDVTAAYRQIRVALDGTLLGFEFGGYIFVDLRLQFGWKNSAGWWDLVGSMLSWKHNERQQSYSYDVMEEATQLVRGLMVPPRVAGRERLPITSVRRDPAAVARCRPGYHFSAIYVDDTMTAEVEGPAERMSAVTTVMVSDHYKALGPPVGGVPSCVSARKVTGWDTTEDMVGWRLNTDNMTITLPPHKLVDLRLYLHDKWPASRQWTTLVELQELTGKMFYVSTVLREGRFNVWRITQNMRSFGKEWRQPAASRDPVRRRITEATQCDIELWRCMIQQPAERLVGFIAEHIKREPVKQLWSDASFKGMGGVDPAAGLFWWWEMPAECEPRLVNTSAAAASTAPEAPSHTESNPGSKPIDINLLELLGMVATFYAFTHGKTPEYAADLVRLRGDNNSAVQWVQKRGGGCRTRGGQQ